MNDHVPPTESPWGKIDHIRELSAGIYQVSTPGHGGIFLTPEHNERVPTTIRESNGWYEHDVDWSIVAVVFPGVFSPAQRQRATAILRHWRPDAFETLTGQTLKPGESVMRDRAAFDLEHQADQVVIAAWGGPLAGVAAGEVLVCAKTGGRRADGSCAADAIESWHLVPAADYAARGPHGFIVPRGTPETTARPYGR